MGIASSDENRISGMTGFERKEMKQFDKLFRL